MCPYAAVAHDAHVIRIQGEGVEDIDRRRRAGLHARTRLVEVAAVAILVERSVATRCLVLACCAAGMDGARVRQMLRLRVMAIAVRTEEVPVGTKKDISAIKASCRTIVFNVKMQCIQ